MKIDLDKMEAIARKGTPGDWRWDPDDCSFGSLQDERSHYVTVAFAAPCGNENSSIVIDEGDAEHIATFSPDVVIAMIARIRELEHRAEYVEPVYLEAKRLHQLTDKLDDTDLGDALDTSYGKL